MIDSTELDSGQRVPNPTPAEIRQRCEEIQAEWSDEERERRWCGGSREGWQPPTVRARGIAEPVGSDN